MNYLLLYHVYSCVCKHGFTGSDKLIKTKSEKPHMHFQIHYKEAKK